MKRTLGTPMRKKAPQLRIRGLCPSGVSSAGETPERTLDIAAAGQNSAKPPSPSHLHRTHEDIMSAVWITRLADCASRAVCSHTRGEPGPVRRYGHRQSRIEDTQLRQLEGHIEAIALRTRCTCGGISLPILSYESELAAIPPGRLAGSGE